MAIIKIIPFPGTNGPRGPQGPAGANGAPGADGLSAYEIAVENGFEGTEQQWLDSLGGSVDLVVPVTIKDQSDEDFITFTKTGTGTARIETPQDDLSLRSARDITLFAGSDGPGNVYIGWGDAQMTPDSNNKVATVGDLPNIADFTFAYNEEDEDSTITIHNHDMRIQTTRDGSQDADIDINSADDVWITANDDIELTSTTGEVRIYANAEGGNGWAFRQDGMIGIDKTVTGIEVKDGDDVKGRLQFDTNDGQVILQAYGNNQNTSFTTSDWDTAVWTTIDPNQSQVDITNTPNIINFMSNIGFGVDTLKIAVNGQNYGLYGGASSGDGAITIYITNSIPGVEPVTVTDLSFQYAYSSKIDVNYDEGDFLIETQGGLDIRMESSDSVRALANDDIRLTTNWNSGETQNEWVFGNDGILYGPAEGAIQFYGAYSPGTMSVVSDGDMTISSNTGNMNFYMDGGMYIGATDSNNQIIKRSDLNSLPQDYFQSVRWTPNFTATGLTFTGTGTTHPTYNSHYVKQGQLVSFWIAIDLATVTNFGTGQLKVDLPFAPLTGTMNHFSGWVFVDETANPDLAGHIIVNADHLPGVQTLDLHYIKQSGGANSPVMEAMLLQGTPVTLTTDTNIYINGTYIAAE